MRLRKETEERDYDKELAVTRYIDVLHGGSRKLMPPSAMWELMEGILLDTIIGNDGERDK